MKRFILPLIFGIIDLVLLIVIIVSAATAPAVGRADDPTKRTTAVRETDPGRETETKKPGKTKTPETTKAPEKAKAPEKTKTPETNATAAAETSREALDPKLFDTNERPTLADFTWVTKDILAGKVPEDEPVYFSEILGGWKCYILDDSSYGSYAERLLNMRIEGTAKEITLTFDWYYTHMYNTDEGYDDPSPDSVFTGGINKDGYIETFGAGSAVLTDFFMKDGHQYAIGTMNWPDGTKGFIAITRP